MGGEEGGGGRVGYLPGVSHSGTERCSGVAPKKTYFINRYSEIQIQFNSLRTVQYCGSGNKILLTRIQIRILSSLKRTKFEIIFHKLEALKVKTNLNNLNKHFKCMDITQSVCTKLMTTHLCANFLYKLVAGFGSQSALRMQIQIGIRNTSYRQGMGT